MRSCATRTVMKTSLTCSALEGFRCATGKRSHTTWRRSALLPYAFSRATTPYRHLALPSRPRLHYLPCLHP
jgi:hypothetical protein